MFSVNNVSGHGPNGAVKEAVSATLGGPQERDKDLLRHVVLDFRQMTQFAEEPWVFTKGEGVRIQDETGKWYLDGLSGVFVSSLGYGNERVLNAAIDQLKTMHFAPPLHGTTQPALDLGERLRRLRHRQCRASMALGSSCSRVGLKRPRRR
jgi:adenosylmethionine-8-amino-7-oxononanoate aminotransferase